MPTQASQHPSGFAPEGAQKKGQRALVPTGTRHVPEAQDLSVDQPPARLPKSRKGK